VPYFSAQVIGESARIGPEIHAERARGNIRLPAARLMGRRRGAAKKRDARVRVPRIARARYPDVRRRCSSTQNGFVRRAAESRGRRYLFR
jgi:hypothetical protein